MSRILPLEKYIRLKLFFATFAILAVLAGAGLMTDSAVAESEGDRPALEHYNLGSSKLAIKGYSPVSYFTEGKAVKGKKEFAYKHNGVVYYFTSNEQIETFKKNPAKYEPAYGGWCAYAVAREYTAGINPKSFKIVDGRLMLFYKEWNGDALKLWNNDDEGKQVKNADNWWKEKSGENPAS